MIYGYARVSTEGQELARQIDALEKAGCEKIFTDKISGSLSARPALDELRATLKPDDVLIVLSLDRLARSLSNLLELVEFFKANKIQFKSINESFIDTTQPAGVFVLQLFGALAEFERSLIVSRIKSGLEASKKRGSVSGRRRVIKDNMFRDIQNLISQGQSIKQVCKSFRVSRNTYYEELKRRAKN